MTRYLKLNDKESTLLAYDLENEGIITTVRIFENNEWKLAQPFYFQLVLLGSLKNKLNYFGRYLTKEECEKEMKLKASNSSNLSKTIGGR